MRILIVSQYFPPEMGAPAGRFYDFAQNWLAQGHQVTVVTGFPNFPGGEIHEGYRGELFRSEVVDGIAVERCFVLTANRRLMGRPLAYATFLLSSCLRVIFSRLQYDCVIATSPPPTVGLPGLLAAWRRRVPLVFDIRDIWPEAIVQSGRLRSRPVIWLFEAIARTLYRLSSRITTVTDGWKARLVEVGVPDAKVHVLPNGVDLAAFDAQSSEELPEAFRALEPGAHWFTYAGILNAPQGLDIVLDAAAALRERDADAYRKCQFVLVGEGPKGAELEAQRARLGLDRVVFVPRQPRSAVFSLLRRSFAVLVTLRPRKDTSTVPSKLYESLASGRPVLYQAAGDGAET
ncbi:MAG: glycosyltransferase family 4 protein, partial [Myxococcota bacterium]